MPQRLTLLGSTGSIGTSTLDVVARHPERFTVFALTAHQNIDKLAEQCLRFVPVYAVVGNAAAATRLAEKLKAAGSQTQVRYGTDALIEVASTACDTVVAAIVGAAGLLPTLAAARAGKRILLANKEVLVMSGALFMEAVHQHQATLLPVDSEHSAIYQCLAVNAANRGGVDKIILTASGGPFRTREVAALAEVTPAEACRHPNWTMGRKISVDSATMMNKGLEVIEAHWLFAMPAERIEVVIHPQSVLHSLVAYQDGSMLAQLGQSDMRVPLAYALGYPERIASGVMPLDLTQLSNLTFEPPDLARFPCLSLAFEALKQGGTAPAVLNAVNEMAVQAFLQERIRFTEIARLVCDVLERFPVKAVHTIDEVLAADALARQYALTAIEECLSIS